MATGLGGGAAALRKVEPNISPRDSRSHRLAASMPGGIASGAALGVLIEGEIIPRLLMAHIDEPMQFPIRTCSGIDPLEANRFAPLPLELEADELLAEVDKFLDRGVSVETVLVELLAPSARKLGQCWEEDSCDFVDVTMGLWRLQEVMREIMVRSPVVAQNLAAQRSALFAPMPGDQHSFGALMVEEVFARAGWQSEVLFEPKQQELLHIVVERSFDLVGLTVSSDCPSAAIAELITAIRSVSRNPAVRVIIGGRVVNADPGLVSVVGADGTAPDARAALALAERMVTISMPLVGG
ncbi:cobalamin B12-binding domain-containing protein [Leptolyngbya sp. 15MV]|nr:cobalamin B12-binding domain-containing protein [Leptolyngbya sp. 15MV]